MLKLALLTEAGTDDVIARTVVEFLSGRPVEPVAALLPEARGWPAVRDALPAFMTAAYYRTDADALVVLVDADLSVPHAAEHDVVGGMHDCRVCELRQIARETRSRWSPVDGRSPLRTAIGVAVPAVEAWLLAGVDPRASEASWAQARTERRFLQVKRALKIAAYGAAKAGERVTTPRAHQLILEALEKGALLRECFPAGYGAFADDIARW